MPTWKREEVLEQKIDMLYLVFSILYLVSILIFGIFFNICPRVCFDLCPQGGWKGDWRERDITGGEGLPSPSLPSPEHQLLEPHLKFRLTKSETIELVKVPAKGTFPRYLTTFYWTGPCGAYLAVFGISLGHFESFEAVLDFGQLHEGKQ